MEPIRDGQIGVWHAFTFRTSKPVLHRMHVVAVKTSGRNRDELLNIATEEHTAWESRPDDFGVVYSRK